MCNTPAITRRFVLAKNWEQRAIAALAQTAAHYAAFAATVR
jgi:hypothetical protein